MGSLMDIPDLLLVFMQVTTTGVMLFLNVFLAAAEVYGVPWCIKYSTGWMDGALLWWAAGFIYLGQV